MDLRIYTYKLLKFPVRNVVIILTTLLSFFSDEIQPEVLGIRFIFWYQMKYEKLNARPFGLT